MRSTYKMKIGKKIEKIMKRIVKGRQGHLKNNQNRKQEEEPY